jgi:hypothetical protein
MVGCRERNGRVPTRPRESSSSPATVWTRRFGGFFERHGQQDRQDAPRKHRFSRPGHPKENDVVPAGAGDFERALGGMLAADVRLSTSYWATSASIVRASTRTIPAR